MTAGVYRIHCKANDTYYVGEARDVLRRFRKHISSLSAGSHENHRLQASWLKYGPAAFDFQTVWLMDCEAMATLGRNEISRLTQRIEATIGCAMLAEGFELLNIKPFDHWADANPSANPHVRAAQSAAAIARWSDPSKRLEHSARCKGQRPKSPSKKRGAPSKELLSANAKAMWQKPEIRAKLVAAQSGERSPVARRVRCIDTGDVFISVTEAASKTGAEKSNLVRSIKLGHRCAGLRWAYAD